MVDFTLSEEQINLREMAHDFAQRKIRPVAWDFDRDGAWPQAIIDKAWELGLMNSQVPETYGSAGASAPLLLGGSEKLKKEYLGRLTEAPLLASFCLTEPGAGSDVSGMRTTAVRKGENWVINGSKVFITNGEYANWYTVYAKTDREAGHRGISAFVVPREAGVIVDKHEDKMGLRASNTRCRSTAATASSRSTRSRS